MLSMTADTSVRLQHELPRYHVQLGRSGVYTASLALAAMKIIMEQKGESQKV